MNITVKIGERRFIVAVGNLHERPIRAVVDGETFEVYPEVAPDNGQVSARAIPQPAPSSEPAIAPASPNHGVNVVKAALPGVIASISVRPGDAVALGQQLCVIEAMKMQNVIRAPQAGTIKQVLVSVGQTVKQRQPLVEYAADES